MKDWFINKRRLGNYNPSVAEIKVAGILTDLGFYFEQEVSFQKCRNSKNNLLIFDFIVPSKRILIEYDGCHHQTNIKTIENDLTKDKFAKDFGYTLLRFDKTNWLTLKEDIRNKIASHKNVIVREKFSLLPNDNKVAKRNLQIGAQRKKSRKEMQKERSKIPITIEDYNDCVKKRDRRNGLD